MKKLAFLFIFNCCGFLLSAQGIHLGVNASYGNTTIFNPALEWANRDTIQYFTWSGQFGIAGAYFFKSLEYYHKRIYGIRFNVNYTSHAQERENYFRNPIDESRTVNRQRTVLRYLDIPIMFTFSRSHNQGLYVEVGPQVSILLDAKNIKKSGAFDITNIDKTWFAKTTFCGIIGIGTFYSLSEHISFNGGFRGGYCFQDIATKKEPGFQDSPTRRFWLGFNGAVYYKINKYAAKTNHGANHKY